MDFPVAILVYYRFMHIQRILLPVHPTTQPYPKPFFNRLHFKMASSTTWALLNSPSHIPFCWGFGRLEAFSALSWACPIPIRYKYEIPPGAWRPSNFCVPLFAFCQASLVTLKESGSSSCQDSRARLRFLKMEFISLSLKRWRFFCWWSLLNIWAYHFQTWFHLEGFNHKQPTSRKYINAIAPISYHWSSVQEWEPFQIFQSPCRLSCLSCPSCHPSCPEPWNIAVRQKGHTPYLFLVART